MRKLVALLAVTLTALFVGACCRGPHGPHGPGKMPGMHGAAACPNCPMAKDGAPCPNCPKGAPGAPCPSCPKGGPGAPAAAHAAGVVYWCSCDAAGKCSGVSAAPTTCPDGKPASGGHVVFTEGNTALVCTCGPSCTCSIDPKDHTKCGCGKPIQRIDLAGTGLYFCNCMGSCACNTVSSAPGKCRCGMDLHQAK